MFPASLNMFAIQDVLLLLRGIQPTINILAVIFDENFSSIGEIRFQIFQINGQTELSTWIKIICLIGIYLIWKSVDKKIRDLFYCFNLLEPSHIFIGTWLWRAIYESGKKTQFNLKRLGLVESLPWHFAVIRQSTNFNNIYKVWSFPSTVRRNYLFLKKHHNVRLHTRTHKSSLRWWKCSHFYSSGLFLVNPYLKVDV